MTYMFSLYWIVSKFVSFISVSFVIILNASHIIQDNKKSKGVKDKNCRKQSSWVWVYNIQRQLVLSTIFVVINNHVIVYGNQQVKSLVIASGHFWSSPAVCGEVHVLINKLVSITPNGHQSIASFCIVLLALLGWVTSKRSDSPRYLLST